ncbi:hypothetical protein D3C71_965780 [compost metagenome]
MGPGGAGLVQVVRVDKLGLPHRQELVLSPAQDRPHRGIHADKPSLRIDHGQQLRRQAPDAVALGDGVLDALFEHAGILRTLDGIAHPFRDLLDEGQVARLEAAAGQGPDNQRAALPGPAAHRHHNGRRTDFAGRFRHQGLQVCGAALAQRGVELLAELVRRQGVQTRSVHLGSPAGGQHGRRAFARPVQHRDQPQRQMLAEAFAGGLLDGRLMMQFAHPVAQRQQEVLAMLAFPQLGFGGLARRDVKKHRHDPVDAVLARSRLVPGVLGRRHGELELRRLAGFHDLGKRVQDLARHAGNHFAQGVAQRVAFLHAALPLKRRVDLQKAEIDDAPVVAAQGLGQKEGLLHAIEHRPPALAAAPQRNVETMPLDSQCGAARDQRDRVDIMRGRQAARAVIVREHSQQPAVRGLDRRGPAGAQPVCQGLLAPGQPPRMRGDVLHVYRLARMRRRTPRRHQRTDRRAVDGGIEGVRQAGRGAMPQEGSCFIHQCDGRAQLDAGLRLDGMQHMLQHLRQRDAGGDPLQHDAFVFQAGKRIGPWQGHAVLLGQHDSPFCSTECIARGRIEPKP